MSFLIHESNTKHIDTQCAKSSCREYVFLSKKPPLKQRVLLLAIASVGLGLVGCGGDDYQAQSCLGQPIGANDCRHFSQNPKDATEGGGDVQPNPENPDIDNDDWKDYTYDSTQVTALTANPSISFDKHHKDERFDDIAIIDNEAVVASHYHNRLRRFVLNSGVATLQQGLDYAAAPGDRDQVDALSGATEQLLTDIDMQSSDSGLIVSAQVDSYSGKTQTGVGVYVNRADAAGNFTDVRFASPDSSQYYALSNISAQSLSSDGQVLAVSDKSGEVKLLNTKTLTAQKTVQVDFVVNSLAFSPDGQWLYVAGKKKIGLFGGEAIVATLNAQTLTEMGRMTSSTEVDIKRLWALDNQQVIAQPSASNKLLMLQWSKAGDKVSHQRHIVMPTSIYTATVTKQKNENYLAVTDNRNNLNVIQLSTGKRSGLKYGNTINGLAFDNQNFVWILSGNSLASVPYVFN